MKNCCKYPVFHSPLQDAFLCRHDMEIVATTIRVHEYAVRRALTAPKHCSAENKHRAALFFCHHGKAFSNCRKKKTLNIFLAFLSAQPCKKQCIYTDGLHGWVIHFIWGDIFQHLGLDVSGPLSTTSASLSLFFSFKVRWRAGSLRVLGHGYLSHISMARTHTQTHLQDLSCTCIKKKIHRRIFIYMLYKYDCCSLMLMI